MIYVPVGYTYRPVQTQVDTPQGGSLWGAGTLAGPTGERQPSEIELGHARHQVLSCSMGLSLKTTDTRGPKTQPRIRT